MRVAKLLLPTSFTVHMILWIMASLDRIEATNAPGLFWASGLSVPHFKPISLGMAATRNGPVTANYVIPLYWVPEWWSILGSLFINSGTKVQVVFASQSLMVWLSSTIFSHIKFSSSSYSSGNSAAYAAGIFLFKSNLQVGQALFLWSQGKMHWVW